MSPDTDRRGAGVVIRSFPLWRLRLGRELGRYLILAASLFGLLASARFAIAPPRPSSSAGASPAVAPSDPAAQAYAVLFARRYLTWSGSDPLGGERELEPFVGSRLDPSAGFVPPAEGEQRVEWAEAVEAREPTPGTHVYSIAAETRPQGLLYLTVGVKRSAGGALVLTGYPAFVGAPASGPAIAARSLNTLEDGGLETVVRRALTNYLAGARSELAADLAAGAAVSTPGLPLQLTAVSREGWAPGGGSVEATVQASDSRGARYTLSYELDVARVGGHRWEISAIQTQPNG
jgi:hypothetical protein